MPPYATTRRGVRVAHTNEHMRQMSTESVTPILKRYLSLIDERFVRFQEHVIVHEYYCDDRSNSIPQNHHHQKEEKIINQKQQQQHVDNQWYSAKELERFRQEANKQARQCQRRSHPLPRGLELQTTQGLQRCLKNRLCAMAIVLQIQYAVAHEDDPENSASVVTSNSNTKNDNNNDYYQMEHLYPETDASEMIAKAYHEVTRHCRLEAMDVGLRDQIMEAVKSGDSCCREEEKEHSCHATSAYSCLNMPSWLSTILNSKKAYQQQEQEQRMFLL